MPLTIRDPERWHAALYIRLSKEDEGEGESESVSNQRSLLTEFVKENHLIDSIEYIDDGWSGTSFDRPAFRQMLADIEAGRVNLVVTKDLSRLGRDYILTGHYMERWFPEHRVRYISLLDGIDTGVDAAANDLTPFRAIMNDMYAKDISRKIASVKHDKQRRGLFIGGKPVYGYRMHPTEKNRIVVDPPAAEHVRRIFAMALSGMGCREIAAALNAGGVASPAVYAGLPGRGRGLWTGGRVADLLRNQTYTGAMVQGRSRRVSYKSKKCLRQPRERWAVVEGTHEAIVDRETFDAAARLLDSRRRTRRRTYDFLLKGLIVCRECGRPLGVVNRKNGAGEDVLYFVCRTYQRETGEKRCTSHTVKVDAITAAVLAAVGEVCGPYLTPEALRPAAEDVIRQRARKEDAPETLAARRDALTAQLDRVYLDRLGGLLPEADFDRLYRRLREERDALARRLDAREEPREGGEDRAGELARRFAAQALERREVLAALIDRVELGEDRRVTVRFRCRRPESGDRG